MIEIYDEIAIKNIDVDKIQNLSILATMVPGLEEIVAQQILECYPDCFITDIKRGKLFFSVDSSLRKLLKNKCVDNYYLFIKQFYIENTKEGLNTILKELKTIAYNSKLYVFLDFKKTYKIHVTASRTGKHTYSRFDVAENAMNAISAIDVFDKGDKDNHDLHFRLDIVDDIAYLSLKITSAGFRYRGTEKQFMPGAIRPSIANSLVWLSKPNGKEVFLDPFCGSGTIVAERERYANRKILAFDLNCEAVEVTKNNVSERVIVRQGNACYLPLSDKCIDVIVTNLPWDIQIRTEDIRQLYFDFLQEALRVLKKNGKLILLTDKKEVLEQVCKEQRVNLNEVAQISLHGLHPYLFEVKI